MATEIIVTQKASKLLDPVVVRIYDPTPRYRHGGLHRTAEKVRKGGEMGDEILLHVNQSEYDQLRRAWGEPTLNNKTGLPEYGLSRLFKKAGKFVKRVAKNPLVQTLAPIAMNMFLPGIGGLIGQSLFGAASSKASGGNPLTGALMGGLGHVTGGGGFGKGADSSMGIVSGERAGPLSRLFGGAKTPGSIGAEGVGATAGKSGILDKFKNFFTNPTTGRPAWGRIAGAGAGALGLLGGMGGSQEEGPPPGSGLSPGWNDPAKQLSFNRAQTQPGPDYFTYGKTGGEHQFFTNPTLEEIQPGMSSGGGVRGPGSGRSDDIEAYLSDGEYIIDAETVSLLGDGSLDEGSRRLDELRANLRKHKGKNLSQGKFSSPAKQPEQYLGKAKGGPIRPPHLQPVALDSEMRKIARRYMERPESDRRKFTLEELDAEMKRMAQEYMKNKQGKAKGGRAKPPVLFAIEGGRRASAKDREVDLEALRRLVKAFRIAPRPPRRSPNELPIERVKREEPRKPIDNRFPLAKGGQVDLKGARERVAAIQALAKSSPIKKAGGGKVEAVEDLDQLANQFQIALSPGNTVRSIQITNQLDPPRKQKPIVFDEGAI